MELKRFETLVEAWGADPDRWPAKERAAALALARSDARAKARLDAAVQLDRALRQEVSPAVSSRLVEAVAALAPRARPPARPPWWAGVGLAAGLAFAGCAGAAAAFVTHDRVDRMATASADPASEAARLLAEPNEP